MVGSPRGASKHPRSSTVESKALGAQHRGVNHPTLPRMTMSSACRATSGLADPYACEMQVVIVDGANVVGSRPDGWWRDRAGAARRLHDALAAIDLADGDDVVLVIEGEARRGLRAGREGRLRTVHAAKSGDDAIVEEVKREMAIGDGRGVTVVTADRALRDRVEAAGASIRGPRWLLDQL